MNNPDVEVAVARLNMQTIAFHRLVQILSYLAPVRRKVVGEKGSIVLTPFKWSLADLGVDLYEGPQGPPPQDTELSSSAQKSSRDKGHLAPIFIRNSDGKGFT
jgi:hypothetical protein